MKEKELEEVINDLEKGLQEAKESLKKLKENPPRTLRSGDLIVTSCGSISCYQINRYDEPNTFYITGLSNEISSSYSDAGKTKEAAQREFNKDLNEGGKYLGNINDIMKKHLNLE